MSPQLRALTDSNPQLREMMQNSDVLRQMTSPEMMQVHCALLLGFSKNNILL